MGDEWQLFETMGGNPLRANPARYNCASDQRAPEQCVRVLQNRPTGRGEGKDEKSNAHPDPS